MFAWHRSKPALLGVDISATSVKVVELGLSGYGIDFKGYAAATLPPPDSSVKQEAKIQIVGTAIKKAVRQLGTRLNQAITAVPSAAVIVKILPFSASLSEDEIEAQIELEAEQYIPYPLEDVSLDFCLLGPTEKMTGMVDVQVVASRKEYVEDRAAALEWAGLRADIVDVESFAIERACHRILQHASEHSADDVYAVIDAGATTTSLIVIKGRQVIYTREQSFGGLQLNEIIQKRFGMTYEDADLFKRQKGALGDYESEVMNSFLDALCQQVSRSLHFFRSSQPQLSVGKLFLGGGCASLPGIERRIEADNDVVVSRIDPFAGMNLSPRVTRANLTQDAPALLVATGLALRGFD